MRLSKSYRPAEPARSGLIFLCDHASNALPEGYGTLGLGADAFAAHIAYDIGAAEATRTLAEAYGAPAILGRYSRLLIDLNRGADDPTLVMKLSDRHIVPGNAKADAAEIETSPDELSPALSRRDRRRNRCLARGRHHPRADFDAQFHTVLEGKVAALAGRRAVGSRRQAGPSADGGAGEGRVHRRGQRALFGRA